MEICLSDNDRLGVVEGEVVRDVTAVLYRLPAYGGILPRHDPMVSTLPDLMPAIRDAAPSKPVSAVRFLPPVANPGKVVAAPVTYRAHLDEAIAEPKTFSRAHVRQIEESGLFPKATSSTIGTSEPVRLRHTGRQNDHEIELVAINGKAGPNISEADASSHVAGYTLGLDMTLRGPEERSFRTSGDSYTVLGPRMVTADESSDPDDADLS